MQISQLPVLKRLIPSIRKRVASFRPARDYRIVKRRGAYFLVNFINWADRMVVAHGGSEQPQISHFVDELRKRRCNVFLDVGANMGTYAIFVARETDCAKIIAFEPDPRAYAQLQANLLLNGLLEKVEVRPVAVSNRNAFVPFELGPVTHNVWSKLSTDSAGGFHVAAARLDDVLSFIGQKIALKIDIEGHELEALEGMENLLRNNQCFIQVECFDKNFSAFKSAIATCSYRLVGQIGVDRYFANC